MAYGDSRPHALIVAERKLRLKAEGMCICCGQRKAVRGVKGGTTLCETCLTSKHKTSRTWQNKSRKSSAAKGLCLQCRKKPSTLGPQGGSTLCDECREVQRKFDARVSPSLEGE